MVSEQELRHELEKKTRELINEKDEKAKITKEFNDRIKDLQSDIEGLIVALSTTKEE